MLMLFTKLDNGEGEKMYKIFTRNWWKKGEGGGLVPDPTARKTHVTYVSTQGEARDWCERNNAKRPKSWEKLSRKYEYTSDY